MNRPKHLLVYFY